MPTLSTLSAASAPRTASKAPISVVHSMGDYGLLHACTLPEESLKCLRTACARTSCDAIHTNVRELLGPETLSVLQQGYPNDPPALIKTPDAYVLYLPTRKNHVLSVIKCAIMAQPHGTDPEEAPPIAPDGAKVVAYSVVTPPGKERETRSFRLVYHHRFTGPDEISRHSLADHIIAQLASAIPPDPAQQEGRVFMQAPQLGHLMLQCLAGNAADLIKQTFLGLVQQAGPNPSAVYDVPIETSDLIAKLLQFNSIRGQISLTRCVDGILGYVHRKDGRYSFMFVASSNDFHDTAPADAAESLLHVYKMFYADPNPSGLRIFVNVKPIRRSSPQGGDLDPKAVSIEQVDQVKAAFPDLFDQQDPFKSPLILQSHTVVEVLSIIRNIFNDVGLKASNCDQYPLVCIQKAVARAQSGKRISPLMLEATRALLDPQPLIPVPPQQ